MLSSTVFSVVFLFLFLHLVSSHTAGTKKAGDITDIFKASVNEYPKKGVTNEQGRSDGLVRLTVTGEFDDSFEVQVGTQLGGAWNLSYYFEHKYGFVSYDEAVNQYFGMVWSSELELVDSVTLTIKVRGLLNGTLLVESGTPLNKVSDLTQFLNDRFGIVSRNLKERVVYTSQHLVSRNMSVIVGEWVIVSVGAPIGKTERMVIGETLEQLALLFKFSLDDFVVLDGNTNKTRDASSIIERNTVLKLCHYVTVSGALNETMLVEHGTLLREIESLKDYLGPSFVFYDAGNRTKRYSNDITITMDISMVIANVSKQEIVLEFEGEGVSGDDLKEALEDLVLSNGDSFWIEVVSRSDGSFVVSVIPNRRTKHRCRWCSS